MENQNAAPIQQPTVQAPRHSNSSTTKKRGAFLTIMLVLFAFGLLQTFYQLINPETLATFPSNLKPIFQVLMFGGLINGAVTIIGLWLWKKWAVYLYAGSVVISIITIALILNHVSSELVKQQAGFLANMLQILIFGPLVNAALIYWAISRKWQYFK